MTLPYSGTELAALPVYQLRQLLRQVKPQALRSAIEVEQRRDPPRREALKLLSRELRVRERLAVGRS